MSAQSIQIEVCVGGLMDGGKAAGQNCLSGMLGLRDMYGTRTPLFRGQEPLYFTSLFKLWREEKSATRAVAGLRREQIARLLETEFVLQLLRKNGCSADHLLCNESRCFDACSS